MSKSVKNPGTTLRGLLAGAVLAGAVGLGFAGGDKRKEGSRGAAGPAVQEDQLGIGGSQGPGMQPADAALPPNVAPGWKIRVCSERTQAQSVSFRISDAKQKQDKQSRNRQGQARDPEQATGQTPGQATGTGGSADPSMDPGSAQGQPQASGQEMASWSRGDPSLITIPETFSQVERIKIEAIPGQDKMKTSACVLYNDHVAKKIDFDTRKEFTVRMDDKGTCGC
jgi:hypothetical protein